MTAKVFASEMRSDERRVGLGRLKIRSRFQTSHILERLERAERSQFLKMLFLIKGNKQQQKHYNTLPQILFLTYSIFLFLEVHDIHCEVFIG